MTLLGAAVVFLTGGTAPASKKSRELVVHEWGTFTSIQGSDGQLITWRPLRTVDLPGFVHQWPGGTPGAAANLPLKANLAAKQRMETPVIYFYSKDIPEVDVKVGFPKGLVTEWYPQASRFEDGLRPVTPAWLVNLDSWASRIDSRHTLLEKFGPKPAMKSEIEWKKLGIASASGKETLPSSATPNHYFAARETDSDIVTSRGKSSSTEMEKFIFYRGVGNFDSPLQVTMPTDRQVRFANHGSEAIEGIVWLELRGNGARFGVIPRLEAASSTQLEPRTIPLADVERLTGSELRRFLLASGLFEKEAASMIRTWEKSWFTETGSRALYVLPRKWTDGVLPLQIHPAPSKTVRVMVGRAEIFPPSMETRVRSLAIEFAQSSTSRRRELLSEFTALDLHRFQEAAIARALSGISDRAIVDPAWILASAGLESRRPAGFIHGN